MYCNNNNKCINCTECNFKNLTIVVIDKMDDYGRNVCKKIREEIIFKEDRICYFIDEESSLKFLKKNIVDFIIICTHNLSEINIISSKLEEQCLSRKKWIILTDKIVHDLNLKDIICLQYESMFEDFNNIIKHHRVPKLRDIEELVQPRIKSTLVRRFVTNHVGM